MLKAYSRAVARINSLRRRGGATATEYALIIGVASIPIVGALAAAQPAITKFVNEVVAPRSASALPRPEFRPIDVPGGSTACRDDPSVCRSLI